MLARRYHGCVFDIGLKRVKEDIAALHGQCADKTIAEEMRRVTSFYHAVIFVANRSGIDE